MEAVRRRCKDGTLRMTPRRSSGARFFLTDQGCRKGKDCKFDHSMRDEKKRCFGCGAVDHISPNCPRNAKRDGAKAKGMRDEDEIAGGNTLPQTPGESSKEATVKSLLGEANKILKSLTKEEASSSQGGMSQKTTLDALQRQIK